MFQLIEYNWKQAISFLIGFIYIELYFPVLFLIFQNKLAIKYTQGFTVKGIVLHIITEMLFSGTWFISNCGSCEHMVLLRSSIPSHEDSNPQHPVRLN